MLTVGVDLSAEPIGTAVATIDWRKGTASLLELQVGASNAEIVEQIAGTAKVGIDCAFGWPDEFVEFVGRHAAGLPLVSSELAGMAWRWRLAYRATDRLVHQQIGQLPLSVAADRLGLSAMRCAVLLGEISDDPLVIDRAGNGLVVEVYPAAGLKIWGIASRQGKRTAAGLEELVDGLRVAVPWLEFAAWADTLRSLHDAFDAVGAAMLARSSALGLTMEPSEDERDQAQREGWIALPTTGVKELL